MSRFCTLHVQSHTVEGSSSEMAGVYWNHFSSIIYSKQVLFNSNVMFPHRRNNEDTQFRFEYLHKCRKVEFVDKTMFVYRRNSQSITHTRISADALMLSIIEGWHKLRQHFCENGDLRTADICSALLDAHVLEWIQQSCADGESLGNVVCKVEAIPCYSSFADYDDTKALPHQKKEIEMWFNSRYGFYVKYRMRGLLINGRKAFYDGFGGLFRYWIDRKMFPETGLSTRKATENLSCEP